MEDRFYNLAFMELSGRASEEESRELDDLLAENPEFRAEYKLLQKEVPVIKELIPLVKAPENSGEVVPEYEKTVLPSEIRKIFGNEEESASGDTPEQTEVFPAPVFWKWGFGLAVLTLIAAAVILKNTNTVAGSADSSNTLSIIFIVIFAAIQGFVYYTCKTKIDDVKDGAGNPKLKLRLLENEDNLFDLGLYIGIAGTALMLAILIIFPESGLSVSAAYASNIFGILCVAVVKIFHVRQTRGELIVATFGVRHPAA